MADRGARVKVKLRSTESAFTYHTFKNKRNDPQRLELKKFDPFVKRHVVFREER